VHVTEATVEWILSHPSRGLEQAFRQFWERLMTQLTYVTTPKPGPHSFASLMQRLGELFFVRDVMIPLDQIEYVKPGSKIGATHLVSERRFSVVPTSEDGKTFSSVFETKRPKDSIRTITEERATSITDYIPDWTPLAEALALFESREWYLTIRGNQVAGLITYWAFNNHEFRIQLYVALSHLEVLSREILVKDGCGISSSQGLQLTYEVLEKVRTRFESTQKELGGNRFVDELDFHNVHDALKKHQLWRDFLNKRIGESLSNTKYERLYSFTKLRDAVMHGRLLFPTYQRFKEGTNTINKMIELIDHLAAYHSSPSNTPSLPPA
jgi:hypothetical protein